MESADKIKEILKKHRKELEKKYGVKEIGLFGSYIKRTQKENSDIDVLVEFKSNADMDFIKFVDLENYISDLLMGKKVDLVMKSVLKPKIGKHILNEVVYI